MRRLRRLDTAIPLRVVLAIGLAACASASLAQDRGTCITAKVPEAFTLPDGTLHEAGRLALCTYAVLNPVVGLHRIWVDGDGSSLVMSRRSQPDEYTDNRSLVLFRRAPSGALDLVAYVVPYNRKAWRYVLRHSDENRFADPAALTAARSKGELVTLLASQSSLVR